MRARFWLRVALGVAAGTGVGAAVLAWTPAVYQSSTSVLVESVGTEVNMATEAELVRSTQTAADAAARLSGDPVQPESIGRLVNVAPVAGTSVLLITFEAPTAPDARAGATAYAEAYLAGRGEAARARINDQAASVQRQLDDVHTQLGEVNALLATVPPNAPEADSLRATQASLGEQSAALSAQLNEVRTTTVNPGQIVAQAELPTAPARPSRALYLMLGAALGALAGAAVEFVPPRLSRRVRHGGSLRRHRVNLLADLAPAALVTPGGHQDANGRAFNRLRNEVVAALTAEDHTLLVTGATAGAATTLVAANLAAAFARAESDVVLVGASVPDLDSAEQVVTLAAIFDLADIPGLTDVLAGRTTLARAVQRAARTPRLKVVTPGGTASAAGLLQAEGARSVLRQLATRTRYVIVDAPSTASGADAQSLAAAADVALLVVEADYAEHRQVADAATQLRRVGTRLLGAVLVPGRTATSPYGERPPAPLQTRWGARAAAARPNHTKAWTGDQLDPLSGPTTKLDVLNARPPARARAPHENDTSVALVEEGPASEAPVLAEPEQTPQVAE